jgi:MFS family permease
LFGFLQGVSAAIVWTVGLALVVDTVGSDNIGQWMGTVLACSSLGLITSPLLGGIVYDAAGYFAVFAMAMGLIVLDIVMRLLMISKQSAAKYTSKEQSIPGRNGYSTFADEHTHHNSGRNADGAIVVIPGSWTETILSHESHESAPLLNVHDTTNDGKHESTSTTFATFTLLSSPRFLAAMYGIFVNISILAAFDGVLPLVVEDLFNWNSLASGLIFLCLAGPSLLGPFVGSLSDRYGPRWFAVVGCVLTAIPLILLRLIELDNINQKVELCGLLTFCGMLIAFRSSQTISV